MENENNTPSFHSFDMSSNASIFSGKVIVFLVAVAFLGIATGFILPKNGSKAGIKNIGNLSGSSVPKGTTIGSDDLKTFKDTAEGVLKEGGIEGEGQYHLVRPGGDSQNVYMTSSIVDLSKFINNKIKVWGQTNSAQKAGWLMDVGRVEVL